MKKVLTLFIALICFSSLLRGQSYPYGINPSSLTWKQIDTDKVRVIYPDGLEYKAQYITNIIHQLYDSGYYSLSEKQKKVDIILQNQSTVSNGFVAVGPFRSEFYMTPPQFNFLGNVDWATGLAIHEYRHIEQFLAAKKGITGLAGLLFGQNGWGATAGLALPRWFFEGDAVFYETALTSGGRGRMPDFTNEYRALLLSREKIPGYEKASSRSLKEFIPNHYTLGYYLTTSIRRKYGADTLSQIVDRAVRYKSIIYPFSLGMKNLTGLRTPQLYRKTMNELKTNWTKEDITTTSITTKINRARKKTFTHYRNPTWVAPNRLVAIKSGYRDISTIVELNLSDSTEVALVQTGLFSPDGATLSVNQKSLIWSERSFDPRWELKNYSNIINYDFQNDNYRVVTKGSRLFAPSFSKDGQQIATILIDEQMREHLQVLMASDQSLIDELLLPANTRATFPSWSEEGLIYFVFQKDNKNALATYDPTEKQMNIISPLWKPLISYPEIRGTQVYFTGTFGEVGDIYRWDISKQKLYQVTQSQFGAKQSKLSPDGRQVVYSAYTQDGYDILLEPIQMDSDQLISIADEPEASYFIPALAHEVTVPQSSTEFKTEELSPKGLFKLHSWSPTILPPNVGLQIEADNIMSNYTFNGQLRYNLNENTSSFGVGIDYAKYYPVLSLLTSRTNRRRYVPVYSENQSEGNIQVSIANESTEWEETSQQLGVTLPWNLTWKNNFAKLWITNSYTRHWVNYNAPLSINPTNEAFGSYAFELSGYILKRRALQHLYSRWGITADITYQRTLRTTANKAFSFQQLYRFYMPGLGKTHHLWFSLSTRHEDFLSTYKFRDNFFYARGYGALASDNVINLTANYALPLLYPDLPIGPFAFIQRIKINLFLDHMTTSTGSIRYVEFQTSSTIDPSISNQSFNNVQGPYTSTGFELTFDTRVVRSLDADIGFRVNYLLNAPAALQKINFDFLLLSINI
ncbi:MAG: hypothetical protein ACI8QD_000928 [Cyclobacteriaceae bacterium]|jgi:hypothetical protein